MKKLLIVDDDVALTRVYQRIGTGLASGSGGERLSARRRDILAFRPDLMVLDLMMPEMMALMC